MAIDTAQDRAAAAGTWLVRVLPPNPDGNVSRADRSQVVWIYSGLEFGEVAEEEEISNRRITYPLGLRNYRVNRRGFRQEP